MAELKIENNLSKFHSFYSACMFVGSSACCAEFSSVWFTVPSLFQFCHLASVFVQRGRIVFIATTMIASDTI